MEIILVYNQRNLNKYFQLIENLEKNEIPYQEENKEGCIIIKTINSSFLRTVLEVSKYYESSEN